MSITVKKIALQEHQAKEDGQVIHKNYLGLVGNIEVECQIRIGTLNLTIAELRELKSGQVLYLEQKTHEPVEIVLNNQVIARGELMSYEDKFAIQITEVTA